MGDMRRFRGGTIAMAAALALLVGTAPLAAQTTPPPTPPPPATTTQQTTPPPTGTVDPKAGAKPDAPQPADQNLDRIKKALSQEPKLALDETQLRFYVEVLAKIPRIEEIIGKYDLMNGPTKRGNPMTHQEFLGMVTPRELYGSAGIKPGELLQFAIVNWLGKAFVTKVVEDLRNANSEREIQEIRDRIDRELAAIKAKGGS